MISSYTLGIVVLLPLVMGSLARTFVGSGLRFLEGFELLAGLEMRFCLVFTGFRGKTAAGESP